MKKVDRLLLEAKKLKAKRDKEKVNKMRTEKEIKEMIQKYEDIIWINEFTNDSCNKNKNHSTPSIHKEWEKSDRFNKIIAKYERSELFPDDEGLFSLYGKLIALRWIKGEKMVELDDFVNVILNKYKGPN